MVTLNQSANAVAKLMGSVNMASTSHRAAYHIQRVHSDIDFSGAIVLDIGGGLGFQSYYAALQGASRVVCLEPESDGSLVNLADASQKSLRGLASQPILFSKETFEDYFRRHNDRFDVILIHAAINHLNEEACMRLPDDTAAASEYGEIFAQLFAVSNPGGLVVITDCSSKNLFADLRLKNPMARSIEWQKHQQPVVWKDLMEVAGFRDIKIRWIPPVILGHLGEALLSHRLGGYVTNSYFRLVARRPEE